MATLVVASAITLCAAVTQQAADPSIPRARVAHIAVPVNAHIASGQPIQIAAITVGGVCVMTDGTLTLFCCGYRSSNFADRSSSLSTREGINDRNPHPLNIF
jgi:hypothetical protein